MPAKEKNKLTESLIREAVKLEIDCLGAPSTDRVWNRIESGVKKSRSSGNRFRFTWSRVAAVVAASLVLTLGSIGIFRSIQIESPLADSYAPSETDNESGAMVAEDGVEEAFVMEADEETGAVDWLFLYGEHDPTPPDWPASLEGGFRLAETVILTGAGEPFYRGAVYDNSDAELLLVELVVTDKDISAFVEHLGEHISVMTRGYEEFNGYFLFTADNNPGLAWQKSGSNQALILLSGDLSEEDLKSIVSALK